jgi:hypothetical protein
MTSYHIVSLIAMVTGFSGFTNLTSLLQEKVVLDRICLAIDINREKVLHSEMVWSNVVEPFNQCPEPRVVYVRTFLL